MAQLQIRKVPFQATEREVVDALAVVLHSDAFTLDRNDPRQRKMNFKVNLEPAQYGNSNAGYGMLMLPSPVARKKLLDWIHASPDNTIRVRDSKLRFLSAPGKPYPGLVQQLQKAPFVDPRIEEERKTIEKTLTDALRVSRVEFGVFFRDNPTADRSYSIEYSRDCVTQNRIAWLAINHAHQTIRTQLGSPQTDPICQTVVIKFDEIIKHATGHDFGAPFIIFELATPPFFEAEHFHRSLTGDEHEDERNFRQRLTCLDDSHGRIAPYAHQMRVVLYDEKDIQRYRQFACIAGLKNPGNVSGGRLQAYGRGLYDAKQIRRIETVYTSVCWPIAFQLAVLLHNGLVSSEELLQQLYPRLKRLWDESTDFAANVLRGLVAAIPHRPQSELLEKCLERVVASMRASPDSGSSVSSPGSFSSYRATICPSRMILEGPFSTASNRVIRHYADFQEHFLRVDFREENRLQYRWDREVDGKSFLEARVGKILKEGFEVAGRHFDFLAYSSSALREHAVWFVNPFDHPSEGYWTGHGHLVTAEFIRSTLGDFSAAIDNDPDDKSAKLRRQPSKWAARMAQAFTATDPSVKISRTEWTQVDDLGQEPYEYTDGCGVISPDLADEIWEALRRDRRDFMNRPWKPYCYQIRFLGYKGMVTIDHSLPDPERPGLRMLLRRSMNKFKVHEAQTAEIEIAQAFWKPISVSLNRAVIMVLEDRGVHQEKFRILQDRAVEAVQTATETVQNFEKLMQMRGSGLGASFRVVNVMRKLGELGLDFRAGRKTKPLHFPFLNRVAEFTRHHLLRDIKHSASIPLQNAWMLPGVADEGPAYEARGIQNVYKLGARGADSGTIEIYACIQGPDDSEPVYLKGNVAVWRSPVVHPGDIQRVYAIGEPPDDGSVCFFRHLKNVVVFPSIPNATLGARSLASCLGGGDVDGDLFVICKEPSLLPVQHDGPAAYDSLGTHTLDRDANIDDICDFIVEYIHSDVLGLLSDKHLVVADQSKEGTRDSQCIALAELCSQAVDYPKNGIAVELRGNRKLLKQLIPYKPDWHAAEVVSPRHTDYYESTRALGYLYRLLPLENPALAAYEPAGPEDNISKTVLAKLKRYCDDCRLPARTEEQEWVAKIFSSYAAELRYICSTHTLSGVGGPALTEEEAVVGTILAKCSQRRLRKERIVRMGEHTRAEVYRVRGEIVQKWEDPSADDLRTALRRSWAAWCHSVRHRTEFGANSFGVLALGLLFECLDKILEKIEGCPE